MECGRIALVWKPKVNAASGMKEKAWSHRRHRGRRTWPRQLGRGEKRAAFKFLTVRNLKGGVQKWRTLNVGHSWNSPLRLERQSRAWRTRCGESCEMHEMIRRRSGSRATFRSSRSRQIRPNPSNQRKRGQSRRLGSGQTNKGKLSKIKADQGQSNQRRSNPSNQRKRGQSRRLTADCDGLRRIKQN